ncbi:MAG: Gfo/Idh/MocA family protein [Candidatus Merdivicinus sp.]
MIQMALLSKWHVHAEGYGRQFAEIPDVRITVVWDEDPARGKAWAEELGCDFEPDLEKAVSRKDVDAVSVGAPTSMHKEVICAAAKAGKAIFTEKVLAITTAEAEKIAAVVNEAKVPFLISLRRRTDAVILEAKHLVESGAIGRVTHLRVRDAHDGVSSGWLPDTFFDKAQCGGGAMMDLGAHPMYLCLYFLGEPESVSSVFTASGGKGVDDNCVSVLRYADGAIAVSETAFLSKRCPFSLEINGTKGSICVGGALEDGVLLNIDDGKKLIPSSEIPYSSPAPVPLFVQCLREEKPSPFGTKDAVALTRLMDAAYRSAEEGKEVAY